MPPARRSTGCVHRYPRRVDEIERPLAGGNASHGVVQVGATVRKPWTPATPAVHDVMRHVRSAGVDVPEVIGRDDQGRQVLEMVPGRLAMDSPALTRDELARVGGLVRAIHDATQDLVPDPAVPWETLLPTPGADLVCHNDLAPWNLVVGTRWVFIDWDGTGPSTRLWDLAYAAQSFTVNDSRVDPRDAAADLAAFVDGYGADQALRDGLPTALGQRAAAMLELLRSSHAAGREPWGSMYTAGHGTHWRTATRYAQTHEETWRLALRGR